MSTGFMVRGHRGRWLRVCTRMGVGARLDPVGRMWEGDPYYGTVFATRDLAEAYVARRQSSCIEMSVVPDPLRRTVETLGRRECFRG